MFSALGVGWSNGLLNRFKERLGYGAFVLPATVGIAIFGCSAVVNYAYFGSQTLLWLLILSGSCIGMCHPRNRQVLQVKSIGIRKIGVLAREKSKSLWLIPLAMMIALIPNIGPSGNLTVANRVGPDAVSYLLNSRVIYGEEQRVDIKERIESTNSASMSDLIDPLNPQQYSLTSWNDQIASGFLFDALRWAPSALVASVLWLPGFEFTDLFEVSTLILLMSAAFGSVMLGGYVGKVSRNSRVGVLCSVTFLLCPITLFSWQEGFWLQILAMPFQTMLAISVFDFKESDANQSSAHLAIAILGITLFYPDLLLVYVPLILGVFALHFVRMKRIPDRSLIKFWTQGTTIPLLLAIPLTIQLPEMFRSRLIQSSTSGFWLPTWGSLLEILAISNPYLSDNLTKSIAVSSASESDLLFVLNVLLTILVIFVIFKSMQKSDIGIDVLLIIVFGLIVTVLKIEVEGSPNYQFVKLHGYLLPFILVLLMRGLNRFVSRFERLNQILLYPWLIIALSVGARFGLDFRNSAATTHFYHHEKLTLFNDFSARDAFKEYNILYTGSNVAVMGEIAAAQDLNWVHRGFGGINTNFRNRVQNPIALILSDTEVQWNCRSLFGNDLVYESESAGVALIRIASSSVLVQNPVSAKSLVASYLSSRLVNVQDFYSGCRSEL